MSSRCQKHSSSSGFTLAEVLVALAIAAMLSVVLVRFAATTRMNAGRIAEALQMVTVTEALLDRAFSDPKLQAGRTDGRSGNFAWHMEVVPVKFTATAVRIQQSRTVVKGEKEDKSGLIGAGHASMQFNNETSRSAVAPTRASAAYRVVITVEAPSGRKHVADTVTLRP